ncbi:MAG: isoleucine--tRNA ligase [Patescibacteria group bacterium]|nr:isoleucine--tRNA ligase [Patescibacteria group bacterium]
MTESKFSAKEKEILKFWQDNKIFEKSLAKASPKGDYVFYDGPPFATGTPHYGHFPSTFLKDVVPRYWTMKGYHVNRRWGWDCHGLPIENIVEKALGFKSKKDIEQFGIAKFNETCRTKVLEFAEVWKQMIPRLGRWADMDNPYQTMDLDYMESVWWVFKELWDKGLIYEGYKSMHICPRCETTLSQQEVSEGYKDVKDISVTAKFELISPPLTPPQEGGENIPTYILAWTTTPWTLPGNVALAVGLKIEYAKVDFEGDKYIVAVNRVESVFKNKAYKIVEKIKAEDLVGKKYKPLFCYFLEKDLENKERLYTIVTDDFVMTEEGTGVVHIAPAFGEDDMRIGKEKNLPFIQHVTMSGHFTDDVTDFAGLSVKPIDDVTATDVEIVKNLAKANLLFSKEKFEHSYPHCWRCDTPLINYATSSWFVNVTKIKDQALKLAKEINWSPEHIKNGRFGKWLEGARDWSISRQRFWASVMPVWRCDCGETMVFGSVAELEKISGQTITDLHKHIVDEIVLTCPKCGKDVKRIPDVLDTWFDSGSMPYAQLHYPFENKDVLEKNFPAEFIAEGADQTRAWFYYLHIIGTGIRKKPAFKNVIVNGIVLAADGKKMSKKLKNYPDPNEVVEKYGADALRYYLLTSPVMEAETLNFSEDGVKEALQKNVMLVGNVLSFYLMYQDSKGQIANSSIAGKLPEHILDRWILAKLQELTEQITAAMDNYSLVKATRPISGFINELSTWYLRRSRDRFKDGDIEGIKTLRLVLLELSKLMAPFMPFTAEDIYRQVGGKLESVHLDNWPKVNKKLIDDKLIDEMDVVAQIVEKGLAARAEAGIKVRQPLQSYTTTLAKKLTPALITLVTDELNIKQLNFGSTDELDKNLTDELKKEGVAREIIRQLNQLRKDNGLTISDKVIIYQTGLEDIFADFGENIKSATEATDVIADSSSISKEVAGGQIGIKKVI